MIGIYIKKSKKKKKDKKSKISGTLIFFTKRNEIYARVLETKLVIPTNFYYIVSFFDRLGYRANLLQKSGEITKSLFCSSYISHKLLNQNNQLRQFF